MDQKTSTLKRVKWAIEAALNSTENSEARNEIEGISIHFEYAEPGYTDPESGVIACGNWNEISVWNEESKGMRTVDRTIVRLSNVLERLGVEMEWGDEWCECSECLRIIRINANCYSWTKSYEIEEDGIVCLGCLDNEAYLESIEGDSSVSSESVDPSDHDYVLVTNEFENGLHPGQDSDPKIIGDLMSAAGFDRWLFYIEGKGQFDIRFSLWLHEDEAEADDGDGLILAKRTIERGTTDGPSVSMEMEKKLMEVSRMEGELRAGPPSIIVASISDDGVSCKNVSVKDFANGKVFD